MDISKAHCLFEQSGTFKNEFIRLGISAEDYDILNEFGETDHIVDLFREIRGGYVGENSIFDNMGDGDLIIAFFPCIRFEDQIVMGFQGCMSQMKKWTDEKRLEYDLKLHDELSENYEVITKLAIIAIRKHIPLIIENPAGSFHYLTMYWAIKPKWIDKDRRLRGDYYKKPTQYWFVNCEPKHNFIFEPLVMQKQKIVERNRKTERSMISKEYANRFIREFII